MARGRGKEIKKQSQMLKEQNELLRGRKKKKKKKKRKKRKKRK